MPEQNAELFEIRVAEVPAGLRRRRRCHERAASYWPSPRLRSHSPTSMVASPEVSRGSLPRSHPCPSSRELYDRSPPSHHDVNWYNYVLSYYRSARISCDDPYAPARYLSKGRILRGWRTKGEQKMTVQHVHVAEGAQAIVGNVNAPTRRRGGASQTESAMQGRSSVHFTISPIVDFADGYGRRAVCPRTGPSAFASGSPASARPRTDRVAGLATTPANQAPRRKWRLG